MREKHFMCDQAILNYDGIAFSTKHFFKGKRKKNRKRRDKRNYFFGVSPRTRRWPIFLLTITRGNKTWKANRTQGIHKLWQYLFWCGAINKRKTRLTRHLNCRTTTTAINRAIKGFCIMRNREKLLAFSCECGAINKEKPVIHVSLLYGECSYWCGAINNEKPEICKLATSTYDRKVVCDLIEKEETNLCRYQQIVWSLQA